MTQKLRAYETTFIVNASLDDPQIDATIDKVKDVITRNGGEITDLAKWGRKRFAYPIKRRNNGFYVVISFNAPGTLIAKLERHFQLEENILRFLVIALDKHALKAKVSASDVLKQTNVSSTPAIPEIADSDSFEKIDDTIDE